LVPENPIAFLGGNGFQKVEQPDRVVFGRLVGAQNVQLLERLIPMPPENDVIAFEYVKIVAHQPRPDLLVQHLDGHVTITVNDETHLSPRSPLPN
jgi:hypothetical protein